MKLHVDKSSPIPLYRQIITEIREGARAGKIAAGENLPSLYEFEKEYGISAATLKKAYAMLKKDGVVCGRKGKGFFVSDHINDGRKKILLLFDRVSHSKLHIMHGLQSSLRTPAEISIMIYNQEPALFEKVIRESVGEYDYYLVAAHFSRKYSDSSIARALKRIPKDNLILLDRDLPESEGNFGRVFQDFETDAAKALESVSDRILSYRRTVIVESPTALYAPRIIPGVCNLLDRLGVVYEVSAGYEKGSMRPGDLYIVIGGQLDTSHFDIIRDAGACGYELGKAVGLVGYNDEPVNEFLCGGLTCLSTDFEEMGRTAADMIDSRRMSSVHNPFRIILRATL